MKLYPPKYFNKLAVNDFLNDIEFVFKTNGKREKDFELNLSKVKDISLLGQLLIYKFISYTSRKACFDSPKLLWHSDEKIQKEFAKYGFLNIMKTYVNNPKNWSKILKSYSELKEIKENNYFFYPRSLIRDELNKRNSIEQEFLNGITKFYKGKSISIVSLCISELMMNFWAHATDDSDTVLVARGRDNFFQLHIADNAQGIITTLREGNSELSSHSDKDILLTSCNKGVTSKKGTHHQGYGLFLVSNLAKFNNGSLRIYSEGYCINFFKDSIKTTKCGYWKGTIVDLELNLDNPKTISDIGLKPIDNRFNWR